MPNRSSSGKFDPVPAHYAGKWMAWNSDHSQIVADGDTLPTVWRLAKEREIDDPIFEKVPRSDVRLIGAV